MRRSQYPKSSDEDREWFIDDVRKVNIRKQIGKGGCASVFKGTWSRNGKKSETVAIKIQKENKNKTNVRDEIRLHRSLNHPSIVKLKDAWDVNKEYYKEYYMVLEYCDKGSLDDYLKEHELSELQIYSIMKQIVDGLIYLHDKNIIHRDLSLRNILVTGCPGNDCVKVKIADFGQSTKLNASDETKQTIVGTPVFMCPEKVTGQKYGFESDIWSLGIILYVLLFRDYPTKGGSTFEVFQKICYEKIDIPYTPYDEAGDLLRILLDKKYRPNIYGVSSHRFLKKYDCSIETSRFKLDHFNSHDSGNGTMSGSLPLSFNRVSCNALDNGISSYDREKNFHLLEPSEYHENNFRRSKSRNTAKMVHNECHRNVRSLEMPSRQDHLKNRYRLPTRTCENITKPRKECWSSLDNQMQKLHLEVQENNICYHPEKRYFSNPDLVNSNRSHSSCSISPSRASKYEKCFENHNQREDRKKLVLDTNRLRPSDKKTRGNKTFYYISSDREAVAECYKTKGSETYLNFILTVSSCGEHIWVFCPKQKHYFDDDTSIQNQAFERKSDESYERMELPEKYWKMYKNLKNFVDLKKARTPKIIIFTEQAKCELMENFPDPTFELKLVEGWHIIKQRSKLFKREKEGGESKEITEEEIPEAKLKLFNKMLKECLSINDALSLLEKNGKVDQKNLFPATFGDPVSYRQAIENLGKKNYKSTEKNNQIPNSVSSYNISCTASDKLKEEIVEECKQVYLSEIKDSIKTIAEKGGYIYIEYHDGYKLKSSLSADGVVIRSSTGKRITHWWNDPELKEKVQRDLKYILILFQMKMRIT